MSTDPTEPQGSTERGQSRQMSLNKGSPPTQVSGYDPERFLGVGAYGEVWVARERNTGRRVAIKFYAHRGGLDWTLLSREVEKLAFLFADRYVVQLLGVGWDSDPPYYVMEYLVQGSLAERLQRGPMAIDDAVTMFREIATGLLHAHGKGVLHCDVKPANILLDEDDKPRLADFGQSRLSDEQSPALGTLFYMAPEQADLEAVPDAQWDVYALGALLYCMLTGNPPHRDEAAIERIGEASDLVERLATYRRLIEQSPPPSAHRRVHGVDRALADIVDRCLAADPAERFPNVQAVLESLDLRAVRRARLPLTVLGAVGPALLLAVVLWFAWQGFSTVMEQSDAALTRQALDSNGFAAQYVARTTANELEKRFEAVEGVIRSEPFQQLVRRVLTQPDLLGMRAKLNDPHTPEEELEGLRERFRADPDRRKAQEEFAAMLPADMRPPDESASWFYCDPQGLSTLRAPPSQTIGVNYAFRTYFHGGPRGLEKTWRPSPGEHLKQTQLSGVFRSQATHRWTVAVASPVYDDSPERNFLGVVAMTVGVGRFIELKGRDDQFAVLVDWRDGENKGVILQHPSFDRLLADSDKLSDQYKDYRVKAEDLPNVPSREEDYVDPMAADEEGADYNRRWLARMEPVRVRGKDTGWIVIVQEAYDTAIGGTVERLTEGLIRWGLVALLLVTLIMAGLWAWAARWSRT
jgi:hypothetical protein